MSLAHAPKTTCPRCLELRPAMLHTCSPTDRWRELEAERDRYREALEQIDIMAGNALGKSVLEIEDDLATIQTLIRNRLHF